MRSTLPQSSSTLMAVMAAAAAVTTLMVVAAATAAAAAAAHSRRRMQQEDRGKKFAGYLQKPPRLCSGKWTRKRALDRPTLRGADVHPGPP